MRAGRTDGADLPALGRLVPVSEESSGPVWSPIARARAHELVISAIEEQILAGTLVVGDPLPPERDLAARLGVSRAGVREAIRVLEGQGVVRSHVGSGAGAGTFIAALPSAALTRFLRLHVALANFDLDDVVEARVVLERSSAALTAQRASAADLTPVRAALDAMDAADISRESFNEQDTAFHVAIARAGGNVLVADMTVAIRDSLRRPLQAAMRAASDWPTICSGLRAEHHAIYAALRAGEPDRAAELTEQHIRGSYAALFPR